MAIIKIKELLTKHRYYTIDPANRIAVLRCVVDDLAAFFHVSYYDPIGRDTKNKN